MTYKRPSVARTKTCPSCGLVLPLIKARYRCDCGHEYASKLVQRKEKPGRFKLEWTQEGRKFYSHNGNGIMFFRYLERDMSTSNRPLSFKQNTANVRAYKHQLVRWGYTVNGLDGQQGFRKLDQARQAYIKSCLPSFNEELIKQLYEERYLNADD